VLGGGDQRLQDVPLFVGQVGRIRLAHGRLPRCIGCCDTSSAAKMLRMRQLSG
jgi:hypothetical protein